MVRRLVALVVMLAVCAMLGGLVYAVSRPGLPHRVAKPTQIPPTLMEPGGGPTLFPSHRLVAFYGSPINPALGVLGDTSAEAMWGQLSAAAAPYATPGTVVVPTYELVAFAAEAAAGPDGTYSAELPTEEIDAYLKVVRAHHGMLILDLQPGRASILAEAQALRPWLVYPDVGLALDPEWELEPGELPGIQIGHSTATEINGLSKWLQQLTVTNRLPQKLLMVHQFRPDMIIDKLAITGQPDVATVFNMDGFGPPANKVSIYQFLADNPRWPLGYKLFYNRDRPLQTPAQVLALVPRPQIIDYG